jgi:putative endonuclease
MTVVKEYFYVYFLASKKNGTLYIGLTSNLQKRIFEHKNEVTGGFTTKYGVKTLVYFEVFDDFENAVKREKATKAWKRQWKLELIEKNNPDWQDLYQQICT